MPYRSPAEGEECRGRHLSDDHTLHTWVDAMNGFLQEGLADFRSQMFWRSGDERSRGGESLLCMTSSPACFGRSVVVESMLQGGMPTAISPKVEEYLAGSGIRRMLAGHKPCGDSPFVVRGSQVDFVHCDTTYSDSAAKDKRGLAASAVEVAFHRGPEGQSSSHLSLRGALSDGNRYDFSVASSSASAQPCNDDFVGRQTADGGWIKARLEDGNYRVAFGEPGGRKISYEDRRREELQPMIHKREINE
eukprot:TRINITY_DN10643_c0_g2_i2.p1 TRINITY_DN10643_c0_g2~~TRINITY_DN10643_c0_g2_i2.p1  ORF type:complete len:248 (+),score=33.12 TRINITY_DN10643_c0_g2_i2:369-1112(+)